MSSSSYVSIALVEFLPENSIIVETLSITPDSCDLSGAWKIKDSDYSALNQIIEGRLVMIIGNRDLARGYLGTNNLTEVDVQDFVVEAGRDARLANDSFENYVKQNEEDYARYMSVRPAERKSIPKVVKKKLVRPDFYVRNHARSATSTTQ
jgi:hypothetical protein